jgi:transcriptional antiterminator NusG
VTRKFFPGYVLINLVLYDEGRNVLEPTWRFLKETSGVIGFIGGERPMPLSTAEVDAIINQVAEKKEKVKPKVQFEPGETVKITDGPFMSFDGTVDEVDPDRGKLKVSVAIFGRSAPVELEYWQVERAVNENA